MFKKTLLCAALVAASGGATAAATGSATTLIQSTEGSMGVTSIPTAAVSYNLGAMYTQGDTVTLTWTQPLLAVPNHQPLTISDSEVHTIAGLTDAYVNAMDPGTAIVFQDYLGTTASLTAAAVGAATTAAELAALINAQTFGMTAVGTNAGGIVLTADVGGAGSQLATITGTFTGAALTVVEVPSKVIPLTVLSHTASSVTYRAGAVPGAFNYDDTKTISTNGMAIIGSDQADGTVVSQTFAAATSMGVAIDAGTAAVNVAEFHDEFMLKLVKTSKQIDVENSRKTFVGNVKTDTISVGIQEDTTYIGRVAAAGTAEGTMVAGLNVAGDTASIAKVNGNYSWLDDADITGYQHDADIGSTTPGYGSLTHTANSVTVNPDTLGTAAVAQQKSVAITTLGTVVLPTGAYTVDVTAKFANQLGVQKSKVFATAALGAWTLNGSTITAYGIPNQAAVTPFLWIQNAGTSAGEITGTASCDGATIDLGSLGSAAADTNTSVGVAVQNAVDAAGTCAVGSRYDATLTVNAKSTDITVTAGYKVTDASQRDDRLGLETSDSL